MFGYVIPVKCALKDGEFDQFRAAYCGLCHSLRDAYGFPARFILNYDFTFLAILLSAETEEIALSRRRCAAKPFRSRNACAGGDIFRQAAGYSLILAWWRLRDGVADHGFRKGLPYRAASMFLGKAYRRAARDFPDFDAHCSAKLAELHALEQAQSPDLDRVADAFARILPYALAHVTDETKRRAGEELLYHTGRWIYLIDAFDDLEQDKRSGNFNPLLTRFAPEEGVLSERDTDWIKTSLHHSANRAAAAYNLLEAGPWRGILENIIYLGLPGVTNSVLDGKFKKRWRHREKGHTKL